MPCAGLDLAAELISHVLALELADGADQIDSAERHVIQHARARLRQGRADHDMQHCLLAGIEPGPGKTHVGTIAFGQAQQVAIEIARLGQVLGQYGEVVHGVRGHAMRSLSAVGGLSAYFRMSAIWARNAGSISAPNQGFRRAQPIVRHDGCGKGT